MEDLKLIQRFDSLWFFSNILSSPPPPPKQFLPPPPLPPLPSSPLSNGEKTNQSEHLDFSKSSNQESPRVSNPETESSDFTSTYCQSYTSLDSYSEFESEAESELQEAESPIPLMDWSREKFLYGCELSRMNYILVPVKPRFRRGRNVCMELKMPPLSDGMAMKNHLKLWAHAVACTVR